MSENRRAFLDGDPERFPFELARDFFRDLLFRHLSVDEEISGSREAIVLAIARQREEWARFDAAMRRGCGA